MKHQNNLSECVFINAVGVYFYTTKTFIHLRLNPLSEPWPEVLMLQTALWHLLLYSKYHKSSVLGNRDILHPQNMI